jgi:hypothetical protein
MERAGRSGLAGGELIAGLQPRLKLSQDLIRLRLHHMILTLDIIVNILIIIILTIGVCM